MVAQTHPDTRNQACLEPTIFTLTPHPPQPRGKESDLLILLFYKRSPSPASEDVQQVFSISRHQLLPDQPSLPRDPLLFLYYLQLSKKLPQL